MKNKRLEKAREKMLPKPDPCPVTKALVDRLAAKVGREEPEPEDSQS